MTERLALGIVPGIGWRAREIEAIARETEDAGFEAIFNPEVNNDALATAQLMGAVTSRIKVGPWVSSIYLRHSYVCAQAAARELARQNLAFYTTLPYYQRVLRLQGFAAEAAKAEQGDAAGAWSDRLLNALCLIGPLGHCRERLAAYREAGVELPILYPPIGVEAARATIKAFRQ